MRSLTRRQLLTTATGLAAGPTTVPLPGAGISINPRAMWGSSRPPKGRLHSEEVRFLIVHHSASSNGHVSDDVPRILRSWFDFHTGKRGWNDIAYNFIIDSEGVVWEGRQGSLAGAVAGDATGGNQGFTQLVCLIGDFDVAVPTTASVVSLVSVLAWLADRYSMSTSPGSEVTFTSRGSNLWPQGKVVTTPTITGHRTMSKTSCPGDNLFDYVEGELMADVDAMRLRDTDDSETTLATTGPATSLETSTSITVSPGSLTTDVLSSTSTIPVAAVETPPTTGSPLIFAGSTLAVIATALLWWRWRRLGG